MNVPTGYTALDMVGFTDKGTYNSATAYVKNDIAHYGGNLWRCLVDDTTGVTPAEGVNWTVFLAEPTSAAEDIIAQVETTSTAAHSYAVGKQLIYNDTLYTVTSAITVGDTLTVGTNITASDSIVDQLDTKANSSDLATVATTGAYSDLSGKPTLGTAAEKNVPASGDASTTEVVMGDDTRLSNARNAADVSAWAKAANKPTYNGAEILTSTAKTGTAQLSISDTVASGTSMDNVVGTMLDNDKTLDTNITSLNEALTNEINTRVANGAHNLLPNVASTEVKNGITFTVNSDGSVTVSGTASAETTKNIVTDLSLNGNYILSGCPAGGSPSDHTGYNLQAQIDNSYNHVDIGNGYAFSVSAKVNRVLIHIANGTVISTPITFKPMIRLASDTDPTYQPYAMTNRELTELVVSEIFNFSVAFESGTPNSYVSVKDVDISKSGYEPIAISIYTLGSASTINIMSLQIEVSGKARMAYARSSLGSARSLNDAIYARVVYVKK